MSYIPKVRITGAIPIGATWEDEDTIDLNFLEDSGDHLHMLMTRGALETLQRHIEHLFSQSPSQAGPKVETAEDC